MQNCNCSELLTKRCGITKAFAGVQALKGVDFYVRPGTVHALMGENGVGKSTLMKCLFGMKSKFCCRCRRRQRRHGRR